jgi:hypothetical protein
VKGTLFIDYVRMLRAHKDVSWAELFAAEDVRYLSERIQLESWYPMATFERMGLAILNVIANGQLELVKEWGRASVDGLRETNGQLLVSGDARESLMRFHVLRRSFFDFSALDVRSISDGAAKIEIRYQMGDVAEEAASVQTLGFFERMLEVAGATERHAVFASKSWEGDSTTTLELRWK